MTDKQPIAEVLRTQYDLRPESRHDRFCVACGLYWYCVDYHGGQNDKLYAIECSLGYRPGMLENGPEENTTDRAIYEGLEKGLLDPEELAQWIESGYKNSEED